MHLLGKHVPGQEVSLHFVGKFQDMLSNRCFAKLRQTEAQLANLGATKRDSVVSTTCCPGLNRSQAQQRTTYNIKAAAYPLIFQSLAVLLLCCSVDLAEDRCYSFLGALHASP